MSEMNPLWGAPRIHGELLKLGIDVSQATVARYMPRHRLPWQNADAERLIGSIRRECLDHVIVVNETGLSRVLGRYLTYYHQSRTHLSLAKDSPKPRPIAPPTLGPVVALPQVGGLHHRYDRRAA